MKCSRVTKGELFLSDIFITSVFCVRFKGDLENSHTEKATLANPMLPTYSTVTEGSTTQSTLPLPQLSEREDQLIERIMGNFHTSYYMVVLIWPNTREVGQKARERNFM